MILFLALASVLGPLRVSTSVHALPSGFEPAVAIDPSRPERIAAGAHFGEGYNRGGLRFQSFSTDDSGRTWESRELVLRSLEREPTMAADLSLAFGPEGELYLFGISGDSYRGPVPDAALALAVSFDGGRSVVPRALLGESVDHAPDRFSVSDKPWLAVDRRDGSLYLAWTRVDVHRTKEGYELERELMTAFSRDGGRTVSRPLAIARSGIGAQIAIRPDGAIDLVWLEEERDLGTRILHAVSRDGGKGYSAPQAIEEVEAWESLDLPTLAGSSPVACWTRGPLAEARGTRIRCSRYSEKAGWSPPEDVPTGAAASGFPALAATDRTFWLLGYHADETTRIVLHCSTDGRRFAPVETLSEKPLPIDRFCPRPGLPCRKDLGKFTPGDYVGLTAAPGRLAAAYLLPEEGETQVFLSIVDLESGSCLTEGSSSDR